MGLEEVKKEILGNARSQAKQIIREGEEEKKAILKTVESRLTEVKKELDIEAKKALEQYQARVNAETNSLLKRQKLTLQKDMVQEVFKEVQEKLKELPPKKREALLKKIMSTAKYNKVYCSKKDMPLLNKYKPQETDVIGGVILENKEGNVRLDLSYETLLKSIEQDNLKEIAQVLFR